jgi:ribosomal protein S1
VQPTLGDIVEVYLERIENALGDAVLSRDKAKREEAWTRLERLSEKKETVKGHDLGRVKGGFTVDLGGVNAFLPGSQVDIRPVRDVGPLMGQAQPFAILKMDRRRGNIVVSRAPSSKRAAPNSAPKSSATWEGEVLARASSRTSPTTARSWTWAASMACCTSPT